MSGFTQQLTLLKSGEYGSVYPNSSWTLQDYKDMMESIGKMEIIQNMGEDYNIPSEAFILNPDYDDKYDHAPVINSDQLDTALCHDRFNWSFDKPTEEEGKYTTIYITHFEKDQ